MSERLKGSLQMKTQSTDSTFISSVRTREVISQPFFSLGQLAPWNDIRKVLQVREYKKFLLSIALHHVALYLKYDSQVRKNSTSERCIIPGCSVLEGIRMVVARQRQFPVAPLLRSYCMNSSTYVLEMHRPIRAAKIIIPNKRAGLTPGGLNLNK